MHVAIDRGMSEDAGRHGRSGAGFNCWRYIHRAFPRPKFWNCPEIYRKPVS